MSTSELSRRISHWIKKHDFCGKVYTGRTNDHVVIEFEARTTKTRASSMATRIGLIAHELANGTDFTVDKELMSDPPKSRDALATWNIYVAIPIRKRLRTCPCIDTFYAPKFDDLACKAEEKIRRENTRK